MLRRLFDAAVARAHPDVLLPAHLPEPPKGRTVVIGAGKASGAMARALDALWPAQAPLSGVVLTRYGHVPPLKARTHEAATPERIRIIEAGHPVPDEAGLLGTQALLQALEGLTADDLVLALMSGGGSALLTLPPSWPPSFPPALPQRGWPLQDEQALHTQLLRCGASIGEMNMVRRHLSAIKGGRLARWCQPARLVTLAISDVPGDALEDIASGPTVADPSTCADALRVIERYQLQVPPAALQGLRDGSLETLKPGDPALQGSTVRLIATPQDALEAAAQCARSEGWHAYILSDRIEGQAREAGAWHAALALQVAERAQPFQAPCVILSGGETTVTLNAAAGQPGMGGRNTEFLLGAALALQGHARIWMLAADTDGIDGHSHAAGACIGPRTLLQAALQGLDAGAMLNAHRSGELLEALGCSVVPGPTFTNVNDFRAVLVTRA